MKKRMMLLCALSAVLLCSCGSKKEESSAAASSAAVTAAETEGETAAATEDTSPAETAAPEITSVETETKAAESVELSEELVEELNEESENEEGILSDPADIDLRDTDGGGTNYEFDYGGETYQAVYTTDNWKIIDSYKITSESDMVIICTALLDEHMIHGKDLISFREPHDMAYEWLQHNIAYTLLPEYDPWHNHAKDVDLNPSDQGLDLFEMYEQRTGKKIW